MTTPRHLLPIALAALLAAAVAPATAAPKIDAFTVDTAASQSTIRFTAESGSTYELQRASVLAPAADWATIDTRRAAADGPMELTDGVPAGRTRSYYRIAEAASSASTYLVVDMTQGTSAAHWPVTVLDDVPEGGWSDEYKLNKLVLRRIPAGTFTMGSPESELGRRDDETPHQVTLSKPYYMGVFEVTQAQWMLAMGSRGATGHEGNTRPKDSVSYDEIRGANGGAEWPQYNGVDSGSFLYVLREKTGLHFDLPTEAQWEYACRAGTSTALNSGKDITDELECPEMDEVGRYEYNQDDGKGGYSDHTTAVGSYLPNAWGLYDMHGNVEEWCLDWDGDYGTQPVTDPKGPDSGNYRVMRGGCFSAFARQCRSAFGTNGSAGGNTDTTGFRLACAEPEPQYLVVDLSGGPTAERWPVAELPGLPADAWQTYWGPGGVEEGWTDEYKTTKLVLRRIPAGTFTMSSPTNETGRYSGEILHEVTLSRPCYMGVFEVTQKQWELATGTNPSQYPGDTRPVDSVSYDAVRGTSAGASWPAGGHAVDPGSFIGILREKTGLDFDLPTEAQWEYACRAGTGTSLNSGKNITTHTICTNLDEVARYYFDGGRTNRHAAVGSYLPNAWGLYDCHGNVWEWCLDWYGAYPADAARDPAGAASGTSRVLRGGSWDSIARDCRSANRTYSSPEKSSDTCGLRLAYPVPPAHKAVQLWEGGPFWAETNIGAEKPEDAGLYFWWGDTVGYRREGDAWVASDGSSTNFSFNENNTPTYGKSPAELLAGGWTTAEGVLAPARDAAQVQWGGGWRMPTDSEFAELIANTTTTWTTSNGVNGRLVTGKGDYASASIFLPAAGRGRGTSLNNSGSNGYCWSSTPYSSGSYDAWYLYFNSGYFSWDYDFRYDGFSVRALRGFAE
jgi:uncharacterized protein (TIGR02145 family)